jgi:hypothetical protein
MSAVGQVLEAPLSGPVPPGYVRVTCTDPAFVLVGLMADDLPNLSAGAGGWNLIERPREVSMTVWGGVEPFQFTLPLLLDGFASGRSQEPALRGLARVARGDRESPPGIVQLDGIPSLPAREWVIEGIDYGDYIRRTNDLHRTRAHVTLTLREYVPPEYVQRRRSVMASSSKVVIIQANTGDTLARIAKRRKIKSWTVLWDLNQALQRKANATLKKGTQVRVPSTKLASKKAPKSKKKK